MSRPPSPLPASVSETAEPAQEIPAFMATEVPAVETDNGAEQEDAKVADEALAEQTTLLNNEEESFALAPVDASALKGIFLESEFSNVDVLISGFSRCYQS